MIHIVVIEDTKADSDLLIEYIEQYSSQNDIPISTHLFTNGLAFFDEYNRPVDAIFIDIHMPHMNGLEVAQRIRETNKDVLICFVTNFAQYAIEGYSVNAFDFVLKPVSYYAFVSKLHRLCNEILGKKKVHSVTIVDRKGISNIAIDNILFFEVANHSTSIHMIDGQVVKTRKALSSFAKELSEHHFVLCNSCYLVNIAHVEKVDLDDVFVGEHRLKISRNKRKEFLKEVAQYFSRTT